MNNQLTGYVGAALGQLQGNYTKYLLQILKDKTKSTAIASAVALVLSYIVFKRIERPPRDLQHLPYVSYFSLLNSVLRGETPASLSKRLILPVISNPDYKGLYVRLSGLGWAVHITSPEGNKKMLMRTDIFPKSDPIPGTDGTLASRFLRGPNVLLLNGPSWKAQRKLVNPAFHQSIPVNMFGILTQRLFSEIGDKKGPVNVTNLMTRWTLDVIGQAGFDFDFHATDEPDNEWVQVYSRISHGLGKPLWLFFPILDRKLSWLFPERNKAHKSLDRFLEMLDNVIAKKRKALKENKKNYSMKDNEKDLLTLMLEGSQNGSGLSDKELQSNLCIFFFAGHDTTANALAFTIYFFAKYPEIQQRARDEALKILGDSPQDVIPSVEETKEMEYINMVIKESLRIKGPVTAIPVRRATEDTDIEGVFIPKGTLLTSDIYNLHHNPKLWKNPETFDPERFRKGGEYDMLESNGMNWMPFGGGSRLCIGMNFSLAEQRVMLSMLLRKYTWQLPEDSIHKEELQTNNVGIMSAKNIGILFERRY
ncbi:cytochrome P450 [Phycomyces nitens]|nr:cytochrome P450 [Phycomyces nitens]